MRLPLAACERSPARRAITRVQLATAALACASAAFAQTVNIYYVPWDPVDARDEIQTKINEAVPPSKIILTRHATPWYTSDEIVIPETQHDMQIWFANGGNNDTPFVMAMEGGHLATNDALFRIRGSNIKINGYHNGVDASQGVAILEMQKAEYMGRPTEPVDLRGQSRPCINVSGAATTTIQGLILRRSGGDGIAINPKASTGPDSYFPATNVIIKDVTCDDNFRQGISVISVDTLTATDCVFMNTSGHAPQPGLEPSRAYDSLKTVKFVNCTFSGNAGNNVEIHPHALDEGIAPPVDIRLESCTIEGGSKYGLAFFGLNPTNGPTGTIVVKNTVIQETPWPGIVFTGWAADRIGITMANVDLVDCSKDYFPPLLWTQTPGTVTHGDGISRAAATSMKPSCAATRWSM